MASKRNDPISTIADSLLRAAESALRDESLVILCSDKACSGTCVNMLGSLRSRHLRASIISTTPASNSRAAVSFEFVVNTSSETLQNIKNHAKELARTVDKARQASWRPLEAAVGECNVPAASIHGVQSANIGGIVPHVHVMCLSTLRDMSIVDINRTLRLAVATYIVPNGPAKDTTAPWIESEPLNQVGRLSCSSTVLKDDANDGGLPVVRVSCPGVQPATPLAVLRCSRTLFGVRGAPNPLGWLPSFCGDLLQEGLEMRNVQVSKFGSKTGVYRATLFDTVSGDSEKVIVKHFAAAHYASFAAFIELATQSVRSPLIHYPTSSCLDRDTATVLQVQPLLQDAFPLPALIASWKSMVPEVAFRERVEVAMQVLCIFKFLHGGPTVYTYDDNHPAQYLVRRLGGGRMEVRLVDLDTMRVATPRSGLGNRTSFALSDLYKPCRCFYCHGRSNCIFMNSLEGYRACGQDDGHNDGNVPPPPIDPHAECDATTDAWFVGQVLLYLVNKATVVSPRLPLKAALQTLKLGLPKIETGNDVYDRVVTMLLSRKASMREAVELLRPLCHKLRCMVDTCPALRHGGFPYRSGIDRSGR